MQKETTTTTETTLMLVSEEERQKGYYAFECTVCGHKGSSSQLAGGHSLGDTGDYADAMCPICENKDVTNDEIDNEPTTEAEILAREMRVFIADFYHDMQASLQYDPKWYNDPRNGSLKRMHEAAKRFIYPKKKTEIENTSIFEK